MRRPFQIKGRSGWFAEVEHRDGRRERKGFERKADADAWLTQTMAAIAAEFEPALGGPSAVSLGKMLREYARLYTINKHGREAELTRINHYVRGAGLNALRIVTDEHGQRHLEDAPEKLLPKGFVAHRDRRLEKRTRTYRTIADLGAMTVSRITTKHIQELSSTMRADGLSESTVQKEIALLKHAFNEAIKVWSWSLVRNPCTGIRLGRSQTRFIRLSPDDQERLAEALARCDNPEFPPLVELALATTLRRGSLLALHWSQIDFEARIAHVWTKGFMSDIPLSPRALAILERLRAVAPRTRDEVFGMTPNAVDLAWEGVRERAGMPKLQFRDLRHVGATFYARYLSAHELRQVLGHKTLAMAQTYVNLACNDVARALEAAESESLSPRPIPEPALPNGWRKLPRPNSGRRPVRTAALDAPPLQAEPSPVEAAKTNVQPASAAAEALGMSPQAIAADGAQETTPLLGSNVIAFRRRSA